MIAPAVAASPVVDAAESTAGEGPISAPIVAALEGAWAAIRSRHPQVPAVVMVLGAGSIGAAGGLKLGHFAAMSEPEPVGWVVDGRVSSVKFSVAARGTRRATENGACVTRFDRHATIIALYGEEKPGDLKKTIVETQQQIQQVYASAFTPRPLGDIHATVIGLDTVGALTSRNEFDELRRSMPARTDVVGLCGFLRQVLDGAPLLVQFGGFQDRDYPLTSRGARLFDRSLTINGKKAVLIGWPVDETGLPTDQLDTLRRSASSFGARHHYHQSENDRDPDVYMVLGEFAEVTPMPSEVLDTMRATVARSACRVYISAQDIRVATYDSTRLPAASTLTQSLPEFLV